MGTHFPGHIKIGGKLPKSLLAEFVQQVQFADAHFDYGDTEIVDEERLLAWYDPKDLEPLPLMDSDASFGRFENLEEWLTKHNMSFLVSSDSYCEYEATISGIVNGEPFSVDSNQSGDAVVDMDVVTSALASLKAGDIFKAIEILSAAAKELPEVPVFEIVDDDPKPKRRRKR